MRATPARPIRGRARFYLGGRQGGRLADAGHRAVEAAGEGAIVARVDAAGERDADAIVDAAAVACDAHHVVVPADEAAAADCGAGSWVHEAGGVRRDLRSSLGVR